MTTLGTHPRYSKEEFARRGDELYERNVLQERKVEAVIDTGYNGALTLPSDLVAELGLPFRVRSSATLGDGSTSLFDVHDGLVHWNGKPHRIAVDIADTEPLLGMALLYGYELTIQVIEGGTLSISEMLWS